MNNIYYIEMQKWKEKRMEDYRLERSGTWSLLYSDFKLSLTYITKKKKENSLKVVERLILFTALLVCPIQAR